MEQQHLGGRTQEPLKKSTTSKAKNSSGNSASSQHGAAPALHCVTILGRASRPAAAPSLGLEVVRRQELVEAADAVMEVVESPDIPSANTALVPALDACLVEPPATAVADPAWADASATSGGSPALNYALNLTASRAASSAHTSHLYSKAGTTISDGRASISLPVRTVNLWGGTYHADAYPCDKCGYHFEVRLNRWQAFLDWFRDESHVGHHVLFCMSLLLASSLSLVLTLSWLEASRRMANLSWLLSVPLGLALLLHSFVWASLAGYGIWQYPKAYLAWKNKTLCMVSQHLIRMAQICGWGSAAVPPKPETASNHPDFVP